MCIYIATIISDLFNMYTYLQVFCDSLLLGIQLFFNSYGQVATDLIVKELLGFLDVVEPVVLGQAKQFIPVDGTETIELNATCLGQEPYRAGLHDVLSFHASTHPVDDADVIAEARPQELALLVQAEPVDVENFGHLSTGLVQVQPVLQVVAKVVAHEGSHGHGVVHYLLAWKETTERTMISNGSKIWYNVVLHITSEK